MPDYCHRFVGPMVSFRRVLRQIGDGEPVTHLRFRRNDFWHDLAESLNRVIDRVNRLEEQIRDQKEREREDTANEIVADIGPEAICSLENSHSATPTHDVVG